MADVVPFGKYRGRPVSDMLSDGDYMRWLEAQPWFREKFSHFLADRHVERDPTECTPLHNKLQSLFLNNRYRIAFLNAAGIDTEKAQREQINRNLMRARRFREDYDLYDKQANENQEYEADYHKRRIESAIYQRDRSQTEAIRYENHRPQISAVVKFEVSNVDVVIEFRISEPWHTVKTDSGHEWPYRPDVYLVEIKPTVADDYPVVLRQMMRNKSEYLFTESYTGEGVTERQFVEIFSASGKHVVFKRDVDALLE